jgi:hypothetical protein
VVGGGIFVYPFANRLSAGIAADLDTFEPFVLERFLQLIPH